MGQQVFTVHGTDWVLEVPDHGEDGVIPNFVLRRTSDKNFRVTMVDDSVTTSDGKEVYFRQPLLIEHSQPGQDKIGDIVIVLRRNPMTGRYTVQTESENVFEDETTVIKIIRATRSSVDNTQQAVKKTVTHTGWGYANPRRIGGKPIKTHYVVSNWSPQLRESALDVYDYVQSNDLLGIAAFVKALQFMPADVAHEVFDQMRMQP